MVLGDEPWDRNFVNKERLVWLDVEGVPLRAWSKSTFTKFLAKWGDIMIMSNDLGENLYSNRVGVRTGFNNIISEVVQAKVDGIVFQIRVKEVVGWNPSFVPDHSQSYVSGDDDGYDHAFHDDDGNSMHDLDYDSVEQEATEPSKDVDATS